MHTVCPAEKCFGRNKIIPTLKKQQKFSEKAFEAGELGYLNVLQNMKQIIDVRRQRLDLIYRLNLVMIDYEFLY